MIFHISILEDAPQESDLLTAHLQEWAHLRGHTVSISVFTNVTDFIQNTDFNTQALCFLDIYIKTSTQSGLDAAKLLRQNGYSGEIIFLTAYQEFVFDGYNVNAFNYLIKPPTLAVLSNVMDSLAKKYTKQYYCFHSNRELVQIPYEDIIAIMSGAHHITITTIHEVYVQNTSLRDIAQVLPTHFIQCHRCCIINLYHVINIEKNAVLLSKHLSHPIGRNYLDNLRNRFAAYLFDINKSTIL